MASTQLGTAVWIRTKASLEMLESVLRPFPVTLEMSRGDFVHILYDVRRWPASNEERRLPIHSILDRLAEARVEFDPAIGPVINPALV